MDSNESNNPIEVAVDPSLPVKKKRGRPPGLTTKGLERAEKAERSNEVRAIIAQMSDAGAWDHIQSRDLDPRIVDFVAEKLVAGLGPAEIVRMIGIRSTVSKEWKKIQAHFRMGFRADAEAYLMQQTHKFYKVIEKARLILDDAIENGVPVVVQHKDSTGQSLEPQILRVKGATPELGSFLASYSKAIALPVKLWKEFGAIGERPDMKNHNGVTIVVQNHIPLPTADAIREHQEELQAKMKAIEVKVLPKENA